MKILIIGNPERYRKFCPDQILFERYEVVSCPLGSSDDDILKIGRDAEVIFADAIAKVSAYLIENMPKLRMIHSEGVAYNGIDIAAASKKGVPVCNNKGQNAASVAEQTLLLMLGVLRTAPAGHQAVLDGEQISRKEKLMLEGITDLADCTVGLIGFGDIAKETALRLNAFGCRCLYYSRNRKSREVEETCGVTYAALHELLAGCDIVSLHMAVNAETMHFMNADRIGQMKDGARLINTGRGELIENQAMCEALLSGKLTAVGLDTIEPEPVRRENPVVQLAKRYPEKVFFSPHIGGVTTGSFKRMHAHIWENTERIAGGEQPDCVVNR